MPDRNPNQSLATVITLGGKTCVNASEDLYRQFLEQGLPAEPWWGKANSFLLPLGRQWGTGQLLMLRDDLEQIDLNGTHDLVFDDGLFRVVHKAVGVADDPVCLTPGVRGDKRALYLVPVADRRYRLRHLPVDRGYNLLDCTGNLMDDSLNAGGGSGCGSGGASGGDGTWSWQEMVTDLGCLLGIPEDQCRLPFTPDGGPRNFAFFGSYAWDALTAVLWRLACAVRYDTAVDKFSVVRVGADDAAADSAVKGLDRTRDLDYEVMPVTLGTVPDKVRVLSRIYPYPEDGSGLWSHVDVDHPNTVTTAVVKGSVQILVDDGPAGPGQSARAAERASDFYRSLLKGCERMSRTYSGFQVDAQRKLFPGSRIKAIGWRDVGYGPTTELYRGPAVEPPAAELRPFEQPACCPPLGSGAAGNVFRVTCEDGTTTTVVVN